MYNEEAQPKSGRRIALFVGQNDPIVTNEFSTAAGGFTSPAGPMLSLEDSAHAWAVALSGDADLAKKPMSGMKVEYAPYVYAQAVENAQHSIPDAVTMEGLHYASDPAASSDSSWTVWVVGVLVVLIALAIVARSGQRRRRPTYN
jgi:hypothetical protein